MDTPGSRRGGWASVPARRILVMRYRFIGDTILTVPFLRNLRLAYPESVIDVLVGPQSGEVLAGCPYIDELIEFDTTRFHKYDRGKGKARSFWSYVRELRARRYDAVFVLKRSFSSALLAFLTGAKHRIGYDTEGRGLLLTHKAAWDPGKHEVESTLDVLRAAGIGIVDDHLEAWISPAESAGVLRIAPELGATGLKALIHAAAAHPDKEYPLEHWCEVVRLLSDRHKATPVFVGSEKDVGLYERLQERSGVTGINLAGRLSLRESMAAISLLDLAVCTDSGPAHLAAAVGTPTVALFGPTDPARWRPWGRGNLALFDSSLSCRPCHYKKVCTDRPCLTALPPDVVASACERILAETAGALSRS